MTISRRDGWLCLLVLASVSFAVVSPILIKGIPFGYDLPHHYQCAMTYVESIRLGDWYPSWSLNRNFGYGGMETRLYPPVSHYTLALFYLAVGDWHIATWLTILFFTFIGSLGVYLWAREYVTPWQAVFAGCIFALLPYHLNQVYNTFFYAEYAGTAILPFTFVYMSRVCRRGKLQDVLGLGVSFAALILTHLPLTVIGSICFALYGLSKLRRERWFSQLVGLSMGALLGLAASSFFWIKVVQERNLIAKTLVYTDPWLDYSLHFLVTPLQHFDGELRTRIYETATLYYDMMFLCGVVLAAAFSLPFLLSAKERFKSLKGVAIVFLASCFLITPASSFLWDHLPFLQETQFPWRWIAVVCITAPVIAAGGLDTLFAWYRSERRPWAMIVTGCLLAIVTFSISQIIRPAPFIPTSDVESRMESIEANKGFTFWWTIWARKDAFDVKERVVAADRGIKVEKWDATQKEFAISPGEAGDARLALFYHPNWKATVNNIPVETRPDENGALLIPLEAKSSIAEIVFEETALTKAADWLAKFAWMFILLVGAVCVRRSFGGINGAEAELGVSRRKWLENAAFSIVRFAGSRHGWLLLVAASVLTVLPMMLVGVYNGGDLSQHAQFGSTFQNAITSGDLYPSWAADENLGYGGLGVRFYPPLVPFLWAIFRTITGDWHTALWMLFSLLTVVGSLGVYLWAKEFMSSTFAILAGMIFLFMPYHVFEIYNASQFAEFAGCSLISFCFLFVTRVCRKGNFSEILGLSVSYALLIMAHLPSSVIGSIALFLYSLVLLRKSAIWSTLAKLSISVFVGILASSVYWTRMVAERPWMRSTKFWTDGHFDFNFNFLLTEPWFDDRQLWFLNLIWLSLFVLAAGSIFCLYRLQARKFNNGLLAVIVVFIVSMLMSTAFSLPIWNITPFLHEVQFPWRWMTISSVSASVIAGAALETFWKVYPLWRNSIRAFAVVLFIGFTLITTTMTIQFQLNYIPSNQFDTWVVEQSHLMGAEWFWTPQTNEEVFKIKEKVIAGGRIATISSWEPTERAFSVEQGAPTQARIAMLFYPHWKAKVNNIPVEPVQADGGVILIPIPAERSDIRLYFQEPYSVYLAKYLSAAMWLVLIGSLLLIVRYHKTRDRLDLSVI